MGSERYAVVVVLFIILVLFLSSQYSDVQEPKSITKAVSDDATVELTATISGVPVEVEEEVLPEEGVGYLGAPKEVIMLEEEEYRLTIEIMRLIPEWYQSDVVGIELELKELTENTTLNVLVDVAEDKISNFKSVKGEVVPVLYLKTKYITDEPRSVLPENIVKAGFDFKVSNNFLKEKELPAEKIRVVRKGDDGIEETFEPVIMKTEDGHTYYSVSLPGFSEFLIYGEKPVIAPPPIEEEALPVAVIFAIVLMIWAFIIKRPSRGKKKRKKRRKSR